MPIPSGLTTITLTGTYNNGVGVPLSGTITITPSTDLIDASGKVILRSVGINVNLTNGSFSVSLICTDNTAINPASGQWSYNIQENLTYGNTNLAIRSYNILLPSTDGSTVDISTLAPVTPQTTVTNYLLASNNLTDVANEATAFNNIKQPATSTNTGVIQLAADIGGSATAPTLQSTPNVRSIVASNSAVTSVFGRTGAVSSQSGDYTAAQVGAVPTGAVGSPNGVAALDSSGHVPISEIPVGTTSSTVASGNDSRITGALQTSGGTMSGPIAMGNNKVTGVANGSSSSDVAAFGQIPTSAATIGGLLATNNLSDVNNATNARNNISAAKSGSNSDITSLTGLTTPLPVAEGGTGSTTQSFVDLTSNQNISGVKAFTSSPTGPTPVGSSDLSPKGYVDSVAQGLSPKASVQAATIAALPANTYNNGASGVGATLTATLNGALTIDGYTVLTNDRVLVPNEVVSSHNGIYAVTATGSSSTPYILTRTLDFDTPAQVPGAFVFVENGSINSSAGFVCTTTGSVTIGTTPITWTQFSGAGEIIAGTGLTKTGNTIALSTPVSTANGGTGSTTPQGAINSLTGTQAAGTYLRSDGTNATLSSIQASDVPTLNQSTIGTASNVTGIVAVGNGGTGQISAAAAFNNLNPMTTTGDLIYESSTNTASRLAGNTSTTKKFLTETGTGSVSGVPGWNTIAASDIPGPAYTFSAQNALTPAAAQTANFNASVNTLYPINVSGGSITAQLPAQPADGSLAAFKVVTGNQQNQYVATVAVGSGDYFNVSGTTTSRTLAIPNQTLILQYQASTSIWYEIGDSYALSQLTQTFPADWLNVKKYGAAGNGKQLTDAGMMGAAPIAPVPTTSTTGGTIAAGTYQVEVTYVNVAGETVASVSGSVTTTGTTSTITIPSPVFAGNATSWNAYVTQAGGSSFTLQNGTPTALGTSYTLTAPPTSSGSQPPVSTTGNTVVTSPSGGFSGATTGQLIIVMGAGALSGNFGTALAGTISTVTSSTQVTISVAATTNTSVNVSNQQNAVAYFGSDDKAFIQATIAACVSGQAVYLPTAIYMCSSNLSITKPMRFTGGNATLVFTSSAGIDFGNTYISGASANSTNNGLEIDHLIFEGNGGHIFQNFNWNKASLHDLRFSQRDPAHACLYTTNSTDNQLDLYCFNITSRVYGGVRSIPSWYIQSRIGGGMAMCAWQNCIWQNNDHDNTQYQIWFDAGGNHNYLNDLSFTQCWFDNCLGGAVTLLSVQGATFQNCNVIDSYQQTVNSVNYSWGTNSAYYLGTTQQPAGQSAPAAPALATAGTGGTIAAGTYQVMVTYVNPSGETVGSIAAPIVTSGSTSTITVTSPAAVGAATGWYAYVTQAGGNSFTRQQTAGSPTAIGTSFTLSAPPTSTGGGVPVGWASQKVAFRDCSRDLQGPNGTNSWDIYLEQATDSVQIENYLVRDIPPPPPAGSVVFFPYFNFNFATNVHVINCNGAQITNSATTGVNIGPGGNISLTGTITGAYSQPQFLPSDFSYLAWPYAPFTIGNVSGTMATGSVWAIAIPVRQQITVTGIAFYFATALSGPVAGENAIALFNQAGTVQYAVSGDASSIFSGAVTNNPKKVPFSPGPVSIGAGIYWATFLVNWTTTGPTLSGKSSSVGSSSVELGVGAAPSQTCIVATGQTSMPSTITLSGATAQTLWGWAALY